MLYIYTKGFANLQLGYASAISVVLMGIILVITCSASVLRSRWEYLKMADRADPTVGSSTGSDDCKIG